jgi:hypothetical protein
MPSRKSLSQEPKIALAAQNVIPAFSPTEELLKNSLDKEHFDFMKSRAEKMDMLKRIGCRLNLKLAPARQARQLN